MNEKKIILGVGVTASGGALMALGKYGVSKNYIGAKIFLNLGKFFLGLGSLFICGAWL